MPSPRRRDPYSLDLLRLVTRGISNSPVMRVARGDTMMQRIAEITESPVMKMARGETTAQRIAAVLDSHVMRAVRGDPTWNAVVRGEPTILTMLTEPSITTRLNQVLADMEASRFEQAALLARATYEDVVSTAASGIALADADAPADYTELLQDAEQTVVSAFKNAGLDGSGALEEAKSRAEANVSQAIAGALEVSGEVVMVSVSELRETNELLRQLVARQPTPDYVMWALTVAVLIVAIFTAVHPTAGNSSSTTGAPPHRAAPMVQTVTAPATAPQAALAPRSEAHSEPPPELDERPAEHDEPNR